MADDRRDASESAPDPAAGRRGDPGAGREPDGGADQTREFDPAAPTGDAGGTSPTDRRPWSGRAEVPAWAPTEMRAETGSQWPPGEDPAERRWWMPILLGTVALVLISLLGLGFWWLRAIRDPVGPAAPSPSVTPTAARPEAPLPNAPRPTTVAPSPAVSTVPVPTLAGLPEAVARAELDELGLVYRLRYRDSNQPAGTIVETDPPAGTEVATGTEITLVIAASRGEPTTEPTEKPLEPAPTASG